MKNKTLLLSLIMVTAIVLTACGGGEETSTTMPPTSYPTMQATEAMTSTAETPSGTSTGDLTGTPGIPVTGGEDASRISNELDFHVWNQNGEEIGEVKDMVIDVDNAKISYVIVGTGGFLSVGEKEVVVPWDMLQIQSGAGSATGGQENAFIFQGDTDAFNNFPDMDWKSNFPQMGQSAGDWDTDIRSYWENGGITSGGTGTGTEVPGGTATSAPDTTGTIMPNGTATSTSGTGGVSDTGLATSTATTDQAQNNNLGQALGVGSPIQGVMLVSDVLGSTVKLSGLPNTGEPGTGTAMPETTATSSGSTITDSTATPSGSTSIEATATLSTGQNNSNNNSNGLGNDNMAITISDMIVNTQTGDIQYLVVSSTFGDGEHWIPVPLGLLQWDPTNQEFSLNTNGNVLTNAPFFNEDQFPSTDTTGWDAEFSDYWTTNGNGTGTGSGNNAGGNATATPTP